MVILIHGVGFVNKGAELMLRSILKKVGENSPNVLFGMKPTKTETQKKLNDLDICPIYNHNIFSRNNIITNKEVDIILDSSGYAYTDKLGVSYTKKMASFLAKNTNIGLIMLPQAFGPFTSLEIKKAFSFIATRAKLIYARDKDSYNHIVELVGKTSKIKKAPDFTNLIDGVSDLKYTAKKDGICIIPNNQMIAKTDTKTGEIYISFLKKILKECLLQNEKPFILIHGSGKDIQLSKKIIGSLPEIDIIIEENPLVAKGLIGNSKVLISSRYHGIINGLSQGVPTYGTGWSHKYKEVFNDYNFNEGLLTLSYTDTEITNLVSYFKDTLKLKKLREKLLENSLIQKKLTENMWEEIFTLLKGMKG